jgi:hypothetical protein
MLATVSTANASRPAVQRAITTTCAAAGLVLAGAMLLSVVDTSQAGPSPATFAERFSAVPAGSACSAKSWPYFDPACLRMPDGSHARPVRIIVIDQSAGQ